MHLSYYFWNLLFFESFYINFNINNYYFLFLLTILIKSNYRRMIFFFFGLKK